MSQVGLIRKLKTQWISPQYHIVYDDKFEIVPSTKMRWNLKICANDNSWADIFEKGHDKYIHNEINDKGMPLKKPELHNNWISKE